MALPPPGERTLALVTGASSGIGEAFARKLSERGYRVGLVARSGDKLQALAGELGGNAEVLPCDLADAQARDRMVAEVERRGLDVEVLVDVTHRFLPPMIQRGRGAIVNTASTAAFQPIPGNAGYSAAKAYVLTLSEALHEETRRAGVTVTALCPGPVHSGFQDASEAHDFAKTLPGPMWRDAETVAKAAIKGADRGKRLVVPGAPNRMSSAMARFSPRPV